MSKYRTLSWLMAMLILVTPVLSGCQRKAPTVTPTATPLVAAPVATMARAGGGNSGAPAAPAAQPSPAPTARPTATRQPLPPLVVKFAPERGEDLALTAPVLISFDQAMEPNSTGSAFSIEPRVPGKVSVQGSQLAFRPDQPLARGVDYRVTMAGDATSAAGLKLAQPVSFRFSTVGYLEVTNTQPASKAKDVPVNSPITVAFNRPVAPLTPLGEQASLPAPLLITPTVSGNGEWLNTALYQFTPATGLAASSDYTVTVKAGLQDTTGGILADPYTFYFRTTDPVILSWLPERTTNVAVEKPITVTFSMPMDPASTQAAFKMTDQTNTAVPGTFTWNQDHTALGFKAAPPLAFGATYQITIASSARPANGQGGLRSQAARAFTTVYTPRITRSEPRDGDKAANPVGGMTIYFASPMVPSQFVTGTITVLPKPTRVYTSYNEWDNTLHVTFDKQPATAYTVTLSPKLVDPYGNTLGNPYTVRFATRDYDPLIQLNSPGHVGTFNAYTRTQFMLSYRNVPEVSLSLYRVSVNEFIALTGQNYWQVWDTYQPQRANLLREWSLKSDAARNRLALMKADMMQADGSQWQPGLYMLRVEALQTGSQSKQSGRQLFARTDLNVILKTGQDELLAWVTDLKSGQPVGQASVRFTDGAGLDVQATTDKDGIAQVALKNGRRTYDTLLALATGPSGQFGIAASNWDEGINAWNFELPGGGSSDPYAGYVYTDRPIYRPGQTVYWKAIVRRDQDALYTLPAPGHSITVSIHDDQGSELLRQRMALDPSGAVHGEFALGTGAGLGYYSVWVDLAGTPTPGQEVIRFSVGFQVAEYRKPEYEISATTDKPEYVQGQPVNVTVQANYFFGGPVKEAKVRWTLLTNDVGFDYQGKGNYSFADWDWYERRDMSNYGGVQSQGTGVTDSQGRFTFSVPADIAKFAQSQRFNFDISIQDVNNQSVSTQATSIVHKGEFYIGLHPQSYVATVGQRTGVDVITVDPQSRPAASTSLTVVVSQITWYSVREQMEDGRYYWTSKAQKTGVYTETITTDTNGAGAISWTPDKGGQYKVEAAGRDRAGHEIRSAAYVWVSGRGYVNWRQENNDRLQLVADKDEYKVGETAYLLLASPYQGTVKALLTTERGTILSQRVVDITGNSERLEIPITAEHAPDVFVSIVLVKGMDETSPAPTFKMGLAQLKVSVTDKELQVIVKPSAGVQPAGMTTDTLRIAPRDTVTWTVQTLNSAGKGVAAQVSLALVDKALLSLTNDNAGSLVQRFYQQRPLGIRTASTLVVNVDRLVAQLSTGGKGGGGGGGGDGGPSVRRDFPDIAYWNATIETNASGTAQVSVRLPDNLTTWTMDARAVTADTLVGQSKTDVIATKDLLVRPMLPRFFVEKDRASIGAIVHNNTRDALEITLDLKTAGLKLSGDSQSRVTVPAEGTYKATWQVAVESGIEGVQATMSARGGGLSDAVEITLPVHRYSTPEVVASSGQVALGESRLELLRLPTEADSTRGGLEVKLEPSLAAGMVGGLTYLEHYPYECVEQTMSRFLPNVLSYAALKKLKLNRPELDARLPQQVGVGLQRIYAQQHVDGGWGWWQADQSNPSVTAYVVFGLAKARAADFAVDQDALNRGIRFLKGALAAPQDLSQWQLNQQAFIVYALAEAGAAEPNRAGALYEAREKLSVYARAYLALALSVINDDAAPDRLKALLGDIGSQAIVSATSAHWEESWTDYWNMNTDTRTTAIVLEALARLDPQNSMAPNAVRWLMSARQADHWETTQENAWAIMALTDWMAATGELEGNYSWKVMLNDQSLGEGKVSPTTVGDAVTLQVEIGKLLLDQTNALLLQRNTSADQSGAGQMYYTAHLKTYLPVENLQPVERGLSVSREYRLAECTTPADPAEATPAGGRRYNQQCPTIKQARVGDVISVQLNIVVPQALHYVVIEDPLPAGAEAIDTSLRTTSSTARGPELARQQKNGKEAETPAWDWWWSPTHTELRDEKVALFATSLAPGSYQFTYQIRTTLPGEFLTLPPTGYEMYFPEVWGRGAGSVFEVTE